MENANKVNRPGHEQQTLCWGCGAKEVWFLHKVHYWGDYRQFCTNCLLKNHQGLFCPICLDLFNDGQPPPANQRLHCRKCSSICHRSCLSPCASVSTFVCPVCCDPHFAFFNIDPNNKVIHKDAAKALLAAAKLAAASMTKAATLARAQVEKKLEEAVLARKRAKEALERLAFLTATQRRKKDVKHQQL